ncbi:hypothetical protein CAPTEDRAFT_206266 [Capitella teleta]|uniref:Uncharacterized protein n=1 Tax=Capitella teleta TaxID=283909 RepID=R7U261_CAPTE|nr:hypothetical protein CAPTEDRAFT_206266 [Capitella teleta]|eukprot:ELU00085.1 hypothetical protein CAPTEDRAFT_206266 [Capitella teleta]
MSNKLITAAVQSLISGQTKFLFEEIRSFRCVSGVSFPKTQLPILTEKSAQPAQSVKTQSVNAESSESLSFADVVRISVKEVFNEKKSKSDIIIRGLEEKVFDANDVGLLCTTIHSTAKLRSVARIEMKSNRPRLLIASFANFFDARTFLTRVDATKKDIDLQRDKEALTGKTTSSLGQPRMLNESCGSPHVLFYKAAIKSSLVFDCVLRGICCLTEEMC